MVDMLMMSPYKFEISASASKKKYASQTYSDLPVHQTLGSGRECRALHDDHSLLLVQLDATFRVSAQNLLDLDGRAW
jgi:hypothetical protein